jgi:glycosyltransferase involved in cell wall biosynthesis
MREPPKHRGRDQPLVSVVVPTRNRREILQRCMEALASQSHGSYEVIVVDDGSTDDTPDFVQRFCTEHPELNIRYLRSDVHVGANPSRNLGVREARGEFVAFTDSDCIAEPDWLERLLRGFVGDGVGAVVGLVEDPEPANVYELAFKGTHRVAGSGRAHRLIGGNMCVRRDLLLRYMLDEDRAGAPAKTDAATAPTVSGRGDEEGLYLMLKAAGHEQLTVPDAVVFHEHHYTRKSFFQQAFRGGRSAARLVYKYYLPPRLDLLPFLLTYITIPLILVHRWLAIAPLFFFAAALAAIAYNDLCRKAKTIGETLRSFPVLVAYYHVRLVGYVIESIRLRLAKHGITRHRFRRP